MASRTFSQGANSCQHQDLCFEPSLHAEEAGYRRPTAQQRAAAAGKAKNGATDMSDSTFPAPLLLPGDDLYTDPRHPPQSLRSWVREKDRNEVTNTRNVIYIAGQPRTAAEVGFVCDWENPIIDRFDDSVNAATPPSHKDVADYLRAFYHGMQLKSLPAKTFLFTSWEDERPKSKRKAESANPGLIGLATSIEKVGIRTRPGPDKIFHQLNLNDLLDAAISVLPDDAYALIMIVNHDIYEDEDDDFCCGRAYGGSRVAVVSTARYNPVLDEEHNVDREHSWPASHCKANMRECCAGDSGPMRSAGNKTRKPNSAGEIDDNLSPPSPLRAAVSKSQDLISSSAVQQVEPTWLSNLWLSRVCQTASHELGHCFGIDHCVYYACVMQGTASLAEDVRQPPYLCPVDLAKLLRATGAKEKERYEAILGFCKEWRETPMFAALGAWVGHRIGDLGAPSKIKD
ncbi:hypothetical protein JMJ35_001254 [Cladonia borealis]|uniref:Uncharacterized protein n=1 Tax=Cladonia borealis TaxID=184061 RepID=A0AA39RAI8_9LECA|nr:hypothetical protein JMJ35_001254 [Cladonia borealis]